MKLRNRKSYMTSLPEGTPPRDVWSRVTSAIYYIILLSIVFYFASLGYERFTHFSGLGQVEVHKTLLQTANGGKLSKLYVQVGDKVKKGDRIAYLAARKHCTKKDNGTQEKLAYEIRLKKETLDQWRKQMADMEQQKKELMLRRAMEVGGSASRKAAKLEEDHHELNMDATLLSKEIQLLRNRLSKEKKRSATIKLPAECRGESVHAPFDGNVTLLPALQYSVLARGDTVAVLIKPKPDVHIDARFEYKDVEHIRRGQTLIVKFPNGLESLGRVDDIQSSAQAVPEREISAQAQEQSNVRVSLQPIDDQEKQLWLEYDRYDVDIRGHQ
ncbi:HlyD family efflux transporter periplasmic adaptor subunit [Pseudomonadota bacterium]